MLEIKAWSLDSPCLLLDFSRWFRNQDFLTLAAEIERLVLPQFQKAAPSQTRFLVLNPLCKLGGKFKTFICSWRCLFPKADEENGSYPSNFLYLWEAGVNWHSGVLRKPEVGHNEICIGWVRTKFCCGPVWPGANHLHLNRLHYL